MQMIDPSCAGMALTMTGGTVTGSTAPALCAGAASSAQVVDSETTPMCHRLFWLAAVPGKLVAWYRRRCEIARTRRLLASFDTRLLKDIGLSRVDAEAEISKGFWRS